MQSETASPVKLVTIEGLIGAGKSVQLELLRESLSEKDVIVLKEPVESWEDAGILQAFYKGELTAVAFQLAVLMSLFGPLLAAALKKPALIISERSPFSNYNVFAKANLSGVELSAYTYTFNQLLQALPELDTTMILLDVPIDVASERILSRDRESENMISREYLEELHNKHEDLAEAVPKSTVVRIDASGSAEATHDALLSYVSAVLQLAQ